MNSEVAPLAIAGRTAGARRPKMLKSLSANDTITTSSAISSSRRNATRSALSRLAMTCILLLLDGASSAESSSIGIIVFDGFLTSDVTAPVEVFGAASKKSQFSAYEITLISATRSMNVKSEEGLHIVAGRTIYDELDLDALIVPSAYDMGPLIKNKALVSFIGRHAQRVSWIASNCSGALLLGEAGVLNGKMATTWAGGESELAKAYPEIIVKSDQHVVVDVGVITSNGGPVSYLAAFELLGKLTSAEFASEISKQIQFDRLAGAALGTR